MKKTLITLTTLFCCSHAFAVDLIINDNVLTFDDPLFDRADESGALDPSGLQVNYHTLDFYVTQSGTYDVEMAIKSANTAADTYLFVYSPGLDPADATLNFLAGNDDSADALTVLSGAYQSGNQGRSTLHGLSLIGNTQYQAVFTTFDFSPTFFDEFSYDLGIGNGQGDVFEGQAPVPEPASLTVLGLAALTALMSRRKRK
jgi:hypothetical protein